MLRHRCACSGSRLGARRARSGRWDEEPEFAPASALAEPGIRIRLPAGPSSESRRVAALGCRIEPGNDKRRREPASLPTGRAAKAPARTPRNAPGRLNPHLLVILIPFALTPIVSFLYRMAKDRKRTR